MNPSRAPAKSFEELIVWQKSHQMVLAVYRYSATFPKMETYGLVSQMRRAATSVPANIAEGFRRQGAADKVRMLNIAEGSLEECQYYLILAKDLGYGSDPELANLSDEVGRLLTTYRKAILASNS
jgi:four helix bundle protein